MTATKDPSPAEAELIRAASAALEMTPDDGPPLVRLATHGPAENSTLFVITFLVPVMAEGPTIQIMTEALQAIEPALNAIGRKEPDTTH